MVTTDDHTWTGSPNPGLPRVAAPRSPNYFGSCARIESWVGEKGLWRRKEGVPGQELEGLQSSEAQPTCVPMPTLPLLTV